MQKRWVVGERKNVPMGAAVGAYFGESAIHSAVLRILVNRGLISVEDIQSFFDTSWERGIHDPFLFAQMSEAVGRIFRALENEERITVHGDYDADGVSGSAVLITALREIEGRIHPGVPSRIDSYIPHRDKEGYGLHPATVVELHKRGTTLIITVDCGIACPFEIAQAKELGIDTIVVDHHQFGDTLPAAILIHPRLPGERYPFPHLAAVGVAFKVACACLIEARRQGLEIPEGWEKWLLDFVSIATVTDMVPLVGENRVLETYGLKVMNKTRRPGLRKLFDLAGVEAGHITSESIGFSIGPRINAAGRMDHASLALAVLLAESPEEADIYARELEDRNRDRQKATAKMMDEAEEQLLMNREQGAVDDGRIVVLWSEHWSPSLVGLVAGKYLDKTGKPAVAIGRHGDRWVGSGRSFAAYDITEAVKRSGEGILSHSGGHVQACGFSLDASAAFDEFIARLRQDAMDRLRVEDLSPLLPIDAELELEEIDQQLVDSLQALEPFGEGNRKPIFMTRNLEVLSSGLVGANQNHLRCLVRNTNGRTIKCIGFKLADKFSECTVGNRVDIVYDISVNEWNGRKEIQCKLVDVRSSMTLS